jgi:ParB-like chromosome segregation protein Spo0J
VVPGKKDHFEVIAGGRRLRALQALAKQQAIPADYPVPCLVKTEPGDMTEISLAENVQHEAMLGYVPKGVHWRGGSIDSLLYPSCLFVSCSTV